MGVTQETTAVIKMATEGDKMSDVLADPAVDVAYMLWVFKLAVAGNELVVSDGSGNVIWHDIADGANYTKLFVLKHPVKDLTVTTMDSGALYVIKAPADGWPG